MGQTQTTCWLLVLKFKTFLFDTNVSLEGSVSLNLQTTCSIFTAWRDVKGISLCLCRKWCVCPVACLYCWTLCFVPWLLYSASLRRYQSWRAAHNTAWWETLALGDAHRCHIFYKSSSICTSEVIVLPGISALSFCHFFFRRPLWKTLLIWCLVCEWSSHWLHTVWFNALKDTLGWFALGK